MPRSSKSFGRLAAAALAVTAIGILRTRTHVLPTFQVTFTRAMWASLLLWAGFSMYWGIAANDQAPAISGESRLSRQLHVIAINVALFVLIAPIPGLTLRILPDGRAVHAAGLIVQAAAIGFAVWARVHLASNWSGEVRIASGHELVRSGPYRFIRHPIYTALVGMYVGTILVGGELHGVAALALVLTAYWRKIRMEEQVLARAFGAAHDDYRRASWVWIPGVY